MTKQQNGILRTEAVDLICGVRGHAISVTTMQATSAWRAIGQNDSRNLELIGSMGSASGIGLGLAISKPDEKIFVLDGDGSLVMQLGTLLSVGTARPSNLVHFVFNNGIYQTSGEQKVPGSENADLSKVALACGYKIAITIDTLQGADSVLRETLAQNGPIFVNLIISGQGELNSNLPKIENVPFPKQVLHLQKVLLS